MKADQIKFQAALMEAVDAVNDVISISKKARRIGSIRQFISRIRNARISIKIGRKKKSHRPQLCIKSTPVGNYRPRRPYGAHPC